MSKRMNKVTKNNAAVIPWEEALQNFVYWKQAHGLSKTTLDDYRRHARYFFDRFPDIWDKGTMKKDIIFYMADNIKPATFNLRLIYLKAFFEYCVKEEYIAENPLNEFKKRKSAGRVVDVPEDTLQKLLVLPNLKTYVGLRDYAMVLFTLDTGIRPKEAINLSVGDFDLEHNLVTIPEDKAKTRTSRSLPILPPTSEAISRLIRARHPGWGSYVPVFCSCEGSTLSTQTWGDRMEHYSKELGYKVRPYDLWHSFALLYLRNGGHAFRLQKTLGHTDISMTRRYVNLSGSDLQEVHKTASPLNRLVSTKKRERVGRIV